MKVAVAVLVLFAVLATETFAYRNVQSYYIPSSSVSYGSSANDEYDNSLKYRKSIDANESGKRYSNNYYSRPSYYYPQYPSSNYYDCRPYNCGINPCYNYPCYRYPCRRPYCPRPRPRPYHYSPPAYYGSSSGSQYNNDLKYRKSLDKSSRGKSYRNKYYHSRSPSDWWF